MTRTTTCTLALLAVLAATGPGHAAGTAGREKQIAVSYADLDLSSPAGATALINRLHAASNVVCDGAPSNRDLNALPVYKACVRVAMDRAIAVVNSPLVAQLYGQPNPAADRTDRRFAARD